MITIATGQAAVAPLAAPARSARRAVLRAPERIEVAECAEPTAGPDELVVEVLATTLCGTDLRTFHGTKAVGLPRVLGHEVAGRVVAVGDEARPAADRTAPGQATSLGWPR